MGNPTARSVVVVTALAAGGDGIGRLGDGRVVFCEGALPGEVVAVEMTRLHKDFARAAVVEVLDASPARRPPPCPHVRRGCGGCTWQHVEPEHQPGLKAGIVRDALRRIAHVDDIAVVVGPRVAERGYRTSLRLAVDHAGQPAYRRRRSHDVVAVDSCLVAHPLLAELIVSSRFPGATEVGLRVGARSGERMAWTDRPARSRVPPGTRLGPDAVIHEEVGGRTWRVSAGAFFQSGPAAAEVLVAAVRRAVGARGGTVVDLYAGGGLLGGCLAAGGNVQRLVSVEADGAASADARVNLSEFDADVVCGDVASFTGTGADVVVADPARSGLGRPGARAVAALDAPVIVLVSCDPASLARDTGLLAGLGYRLEEVEVLDLFPDTFHIETVSRFGTAGAGR